MRTEGASIFTLFVLLFAAGGVQSFQQWIRQLESITERRYDRSTADCHYNRDLRTFASPSSQLPSTSQETEVGGHPWYSHPEIGRDRSHVRSLYNSVTDILNGYKEEQQAEANNDDDKVVNLTENSKFVLISKHGMWHKTSSSFASPLYLTVGQLDHVMGGLTESGVDIDEEPLLAWVGKYEEDDYWVVNVNDKKTKDDNGLKESKEEIESILLDSYASEAKENETVLDSKPLREFGDSLKASYDAGILATANGLVEFHKSHRFCSLCGSRTKPTKAGASRTCTNEDCRRSVYPRIDSAAIMLVTSPCENYALLGRKRSWPSGRYSTLAGFCEVGETLEECCQRETFEESGVVIDPKSVRFAASQPWPFPRSLMVGFRAKAKPSLEESSLPEIVVDTNEMEDIRWFAKDFVKESLKLNGSTALTFKPSEEESQFHVPGKASLARFLIKEWVHEK